jgi:hypothetical protein
MFPIQMKTRLFLLTAVAALLMVPGQQAHCWGPQGHAAIGEAAIAELAPPVRKKVMQILGVTAPAALADAVDGACFWPDTVRDAPEWSWSAPLHFVNIPRSSDAYDRQRDCPDGLCVTEGILKYAAELGRPGLDRERRWQAFAWLCHLVGDLHQPLHAGFRYDRGGNRVTIEYRGERSNLHRFWDSTLARERLAGIGVSRGIFEGCGKRAPAQLWDPAEVAAWTNESHALAAARAYPAKAKIDDKFADASWAIIEQQWHTAGCRLARVLNSILSEN